MGAFTGKGLIQAVYSSTVVMVTGTTHIPVDDTKPQITEGKSVVSISITPKSALNQLIFSASVSGSGSAGAGNVTIALFKNAVADALVSGIYAGHTGALKRLNMNYKEAAGGTTEATYNLRVGGTNGVTLTLNGGGGSRFQGGAVVSSLTILEVIP